MYMRKMECIKNNGYCKVNEKLTPEVLQMKSLIQIRNMFGGTANTVKQNIL